MIKPYEHWNPEKPFDCGKANECCMHCWNGAGGCEWSDSGTPVPGWDATPTSCTYGENHLSHSYKIHYCPKFIEGDRLSGRKVKPSAI